jgi:signal transduction histidine kinase
MRSSEIVPSRRHPPLWWRLTVVNLVTILLACVALTCFILLRTHYALSRLSLEEFVRLQEILRTNQLLGWRILLEEASTELTLGFVVSVVLALGLGIILARSLAQRFSRFASSIHQFSNADLSARADIPNGPQELVALAEDFNRMAARLEHLERERRFESAAIAHELRTPITAMRLRVLGLMDGIHELHPTEIQPLNAQLSTLERLAEDLQTLTLHDAEHLRLNLETLAINDVLDTLKLAFVPIFDDKNVHLELHADADFTLRADPHRLQQALGNLLENALKYTPSGGRVRVSVHHDSLGVNFSVQDSGHGVPTSRLEQVFDRFYRLDDSRARVNGGSGLGLSIVRVIAEAHGGQARAARSAIGGLEVSVLLPRS